MANQGVHTGFWIDHSRGSVLGSTVTLEAKWGSNIVSAAAVIVQLIGVAFWSILAFAIHQRQAAPEPRDEFDAQAQVLLRNTSGAESAVLDFLGLARAWHRHASKPWLRASKIASTPALVWSAFIVAGIFVGQLATQSYDNVAVLLEHGACGNIQSTGSQSSINGQNQVQSNVSGVSMQYARSCYSGGGSASAISCSVYPRASLQYNYTVDQPCPIPGDDTCFQETIGSPMTLQTKKLDSHKDIGINAESKNRLTFEYRATCAPLNYTFIDHFVYREDVSASETSYGNATVNYYTVGKWLTSQDGPVRDHLFQYAPLIRWWGLGNVAYTLQSYQSLYPHNGEYSQFIPSAPFNQTAADISLLTLAPNAITFTEPVDDPLFRTFSEPDPNISGGGGASYVPSQYVYFVACGEEWRLSNPNNGRSTGWNTIVGLNADYDMWKQELRLNEQQNATYWRLTTMLSQANIFNAVYNIPNPLQASSYLSSPTGSQPLPDGFWRKEVEGWFQAVLAQIQYLQTIWVNVPEDIVNASGLELVPPQTKALLDQCSQQRVTAPAQYQSYNFFALIFIAFFGILIPGMAAVLKWKHHLLPGCQRGSYRHANYEAEGVLQLHRMALERAGYGGWRESRDKSIPITDSAHKRLAQAALDRDGPGRGLTHYPDTNETLEMNSMSTMRKSASGYQEVLKDDGESPSRDLDLPRVANSSWFRSST